MNIKKLAGRAHAINVSKGFYDPRPNEGQTLWLVCTELAELTEADRCNHHGDMGKYEMEHKKISNSKYSDSEKVRHKAKSFERHVKNCIGDELADAFIRMLDYCVGFKIPIDEAGIKREPRRMGGKKMGNLGSTLLELSALLQFLHKGITKVATAKIIIARLIWLSEQLDVPLNRHVRYKMEYNATRPRKHNKKY